MPKNIVVLGGSYAGVYETHYLLQKVIPTLPTTETYRIFVVDLANQFYSNVPAPRGVVNSKLMPYDKFFYDYKEVFGRYSQSQVTFVHARITGLDLTNRTVSLVKAADGTSDSLDYHTLIIATGNTYESGIWYVENSAAETQKILATYETALGTAKTVLIAGGGPVGVELAGEVGEQLNGAAGFFSREPSRKNAEVMLYSGSTKLLPVLSTATASKAERFLKRVGVDVVHHIKVVSSAPAANGQTAVTLSTGETKTVDVYISATGAKPATSWAPPAILSERRRIAVNPKTLRVDAPEAGPRVFALGDVASSSPGGFFNILNAIPVVGENVKRDLLADARGQGTAPGADKEFKTAPAETQFVPIGRSKGVASVFGWSMPSFFVWMIKGRDYMTGMTRGKILGDSV